MLHHGRILKKALDKQGVTQTKAAELIGMSRNNFIRYFKEEEFNDAFIEKLTAGLGIPASAFSSAPVNQHIGNGNTNTVQVVGNYNDCMAELLKAKDEIIRLLSENSSLKDRLLALQTK